MIGPVGFATRNLQRRGFHALLAFIGLTVTTASTIFLLLVGQSLIASLSPEFDSRSTLGISYLLFGYITLALAFILIVGLVSASYLVSMMISQRTRDIGVIKAAGAPASRLFAYALTEAMIVFLGSSVIGGLLSAGLYTLWTGMLQFPQAATITIFAVTVLSFFLSYFVARYHAWRLIKSSTSNAISSHLSSLDLKKVGKPVRVKRLGLPFNLASRTALRNRRFARTVLSVSLCVFLSTTILTGALVSWNTSDKYVLEAMPPNTIIIGTAPMVDQYVRMGQSFSTITSIPEIDGFAQSNIIEPSLVNLTRDLPGVERVDTRLMNLTTVEGYTATQIVEDQNGNRILVPPVYLGRTRVLFVGLDPAQTIGEWHSSNGFLRSTDSSNTIVVGDSLIGGIIQQPLNGSEIRALTGASFEVKGAVIDPLNRGRVVYANVTRVQQILGISGYNLLLVRTDGTSNTQQMLQQFESTHGLVAFSQDEILSGNTAFLDGMWTRILILPLLTLLLIGAILLSYLSSSFSDRFNDYIAIRVLGARGVYLLKLLLWEAGGIVMLCALLALPLAVIFSTLFLVPGVQVRTQDVAVAVTLELAALAIVAIGSAVAYWKKLTQVTVKDLRS